MSKIVSTNQSKIRIDWTQTQRQYATMPRVDSPFVQSELLDCFRWNSRLTRDLRCVGGGSIYHACHAPELRAIVRQKAVVPRSDVDLIRRGDIETQQGIWFSMQPWHIQYQNNHFGPFLIRLPLAVLEGTRFYVFKRQ